MTHLEESVSKTHKLCVSVPSVLQQVVCERSRLFPNPAKDQISIQCSRETEQLKVVIKDLSGRTVLVKTLQVKGFICNLDIELPNGAYLIYVINSEDDKVVKKLLISK